MQTLAVAICASGLAPAMPRGIGSSGIGACIIASHLQHETAGRTWRATSHAPAGVCKACTSPIPSPRDPKRRLGGGYGCKSADVLTGGDLRVNVLHAGGQPADERRRARSAQLEAENEHGRSMIARYGREQPRQLFAAVGQAGGERKRVAVIPGCGVSRCP